eukprot:2844272-Prymnesium_polylepis.1
MPACARLPRRVTPTFLCPPSVHTRSARACYPLSSQLDPRGPLAPRRPRPHHLHPRLHRSLARRAVPRAHVFAAAQHADRDGRADRVPGGGALAVVGNRD